MLFYVKLTNNQSTTDWCPKVLSILLHPLELVVLHQVTSLSPNVSTILGSAKSVYNGISPISTKSFANFFTGFRSSVVAEVMLGSTKGWVVLGLGQLVKARRMLGQGTLEGGSPGACFGKVRKVGIFALHATSAIIFIFALYYSFR